MSHTYTQRSSMGKTATRKVPAPAVPSMDALRSGALQPTREQIGRRVDLPAVMRTKMENAFGADLSAVKLYESQAVSDVGANAVTRGSDIAFAPGMLDFSSFAGQTLLGHELSHVVSQARGEVTGSGFLNDSALESRADREGAMAAAGRQIAMPTAAISSVSAAPAAGPMQADKNEERMKQAALFRSKEIEAYDKSVLSDDPEERAAMQEQYALNREQKAKLMRKAGVGDEEIASDNAQTTDVLKMMARSHERNVVAPTIAERAKADEESRALDKQRVFGDEREPYRRAALDKALGEKADHYTAYMGDLKKILAHMSDEELRSQPNVQKAMVDSYSATHRALADANRSGLGTDTDGSFIPGEKDDLLGTMYGRMIGKDKITSALTTGTQNDSAGAIAEEIGLDDDTLLGLDTEKGRTHPIGQLLMRQFDRTHLGRHGQQAYSNVERQANTMRGFWSTAVMPAAAGSPEAAARAAEMNETMTGITNQQVIDRQRGEYIPGTDKDLTAEAGGDFLLTLTRKGADRKGPMPPPKKEEPQAPAREPQTEEKKSTLSRISQSIRNKAHKAKKKGKSIFKRVFGKKAPEEEASDDAAEVAAEVAAEEAE